MQGSKKEPDISTAKSTSDSGQSCQTWWSPTESHYQESYLSKNSALKMGLPSQRHQSVKLLDFSFQDQDSCSTQSTGQSYARASSTGENNLNPQRLDFTHSGVTVSHDKHEEGNDKFNSMGTQNYFLPHLQVDYNRSSPQLAIPFPDQYYNGVLSAYGPQTVVMGVMPARVPLPLDLSTSEPIYVNPKQYHGILRRRQHRAKLEARNRLARNRKPYLHESRHQHALKRARGSGGRFLNTKKLQESKPASTADGQNFLGSVSHHLGGNRSESEVHQRAYNRKGTSTASGSDVTSNSTGDDIYHPPEFSFSSYSSRIGGLMHGGGGNYV
uniref:Nuclear transcription factor Y subunit n=1 Tax=Sesuvium portulacastrum TaxID=221166 RepID=A0A2I7ZAT7_SESPO|nr:nuclear factor Y subunit A8' [Sesuvium portulacastrum]